MWNFTASRVIVRHFCSLKLNKLQSPKSVSAWWPSRGGVGSFLSIEQKRNVAIGKRQRRSDDYPKFIGPLHELVSLLSRALETSRQSYSGRATRFLLVRARRFLHHRTRACILLSLSLSLSFSLFALYFNTDASVCNSVYVCMFSSIWPWMPPEDYGVRVWRVPQGSSSSSTSSFFFFLFFFTLRILTTVGYANIVSPMGLSLLPSSRDGDGLHDFASNARWVARTIQEQDEARDPPVARSQSLRVSSSVFGRMLQAKGERKCGTVDHFLTFYVASIQTGISGSTNDFRKCIFSIWRSDFEWL